MMKILFPLALMISSCVGKSPKPLLDHVAAKNLSLDDHTLYFPVGEFVESPKKSPAQEPPKKKVADKSIKRVLLDYIRLAKERILLASAYPLDKELLQLLERKANAGVEVKIFVSHQQAVAGLKDAPALQVRTPLGSGIYPWFHEFLVLDDYQTLLLKRRLEPSNHEEDPWGLLMTFSAMERADIVQAFSCAHETLWSRNSLNLLIYGRRCSVAEVAQFFPQIKSAVELKNLFSNFISSAHERVEVIWSPAAHDRWGPLLSEHLKQKSNVILQEQIMKENVLEIILIDGKRALMREGPWSETLTDFTLDAAVILTDPLHTKLLGDYYGSRSL